MLLSQFSHRFLMLLAVCMLVITVTGCETTQTKSQKQAAIKGAGQMGVQHVVLLWLKDGKEGKDPEALAAVRKAAEELRMIESVQKIYIGSALPGRDGIVDSSFDIGMVMQFASKEDLQTYLDHPEHMKRARYVLEPHTHRIIVYDIEYK